MTKPAPENRRSSPMIRLVRNPICHVLRDVTMQVTINGKSWRFLINTGSQVTVQCGKCALDNQ